MWNVWRRAFTLVELMVVVTVIALLAAVAIPNLVRARVAANESSAQATLKSVAVAIETYAIANGAYPSTVTSLSSASPAYLNRNYFSGDVYNGYTYAVSTLTDHAYAIVATPVSGNHGRTTFTIATGAVLSSNP